MNRKTMLGTVTTMVLLGLPAAGTAQMGGGSQAMTPFKEAQVKDLQTMKDKFYRLGDAFPESSFDWRPMEGVRSVKDVLALMVAECNLFPAMWGGARGEGAAAGFGPEIQRAGAMSKAEILAEVNKAFDHMIASVSGMDDDARMMEADFFGQRVAASTAVMMASADMHEHLGQLIAYARTNEIVPPWSRGGGM
ncbi:MAG: DinB family protein [Gemmatimonadota bacterium]|jgi:hypothetical protein